MRIRQTTEFQRWFKKLRYSTAKAKILDRIERLASSNPGDVKPIQKGISELRIHHGKGYHIYYKQTGGELILILVGGDKSTQKADIKKSIRILNKL